MKSEAELHTADAIERELEAVSLFEDVRTVATVAGQLFAIGSAEDARQAVTQAREIVAEAHRQMKNVGKSPKNPCKARRCK